MSTSRARVSAMTILGLIFREATLLACPVCFRIDDGPTSAGIRAAVVVLVAVTAAVLGGFGLFVLRFLRRSRAHGLRGHLHSS